MKNKYKEFSIVNNDVLRSLRFLLNINDPKMTEIFALGGAPVSADEVATYLKKEDEPGYLVCDDKTMAHFLNGLVVFKRGKDETRPEAPLEIPITNNIILKKVRVAFNLKEDEILKLLHDAGFTVGRAELSAFFRRKDHSNYRACGDQFLRNFLKGLTAIHRPV